MRKLTLRGRLLPLIAVAALSVAACGGDDGTPTPVPPTPAPRTPTAQVAPTATTQPTATAQPGATARPTVTAQPGAPTPTPRPVATTPPVAPAEQPRYGGVLKKRQSNDFSTPDLYDSRAFSDIQVFMPLFNNLILIDPYNEADLAGDLAESWTITDDGLKLTFKTRRGVQWQDGKLFTAADVAYTYNRAMKPPSAAIRRNAEIFISVGTVQATDDSTVVVTLKTPSASFLRGIGSASVPILPAHLPNIDEWARKPVGTGAFKFEKRQAGVSLSLVKSGNYWKKDAKGNSLPYLDGIDFTVVSDSALALAAMRARRFDVIIPSDSIAFSAGLLSGAVQRELPELVLGRSLAARFDLQFNKVPPFTDLRVRKAIHLAFDRHTLAELKTSEQPATPFASPLVSTSLGGLWGIPEDELGKMPGFRKDKTVDRAEAKRLIEQSGINSRQFLFKIPTIRRNIEIDAIASFIAEHGFRTEVRIVETGGAFTQVLLNGDFEIARNSGIPTFDDPTSYLTNFVVTGGSANYGKWSDPQLDGLLAQQEATLDVVKRRQILLDAQHRVLETLFIMPMFNVRNNWAWFPHVKNHPKWTLAFGTQFRLDEVWLTM